MCCVSAGFHTGYFAWRGEENFSRASTKHIGSEGIPQEKFGLASTPAGPRCWVPYTPAGPRCWVSYTPAGPRCWVS